MKTLETIMTFFDIKRYLSSNKRNLRRNAGFLNIKLKSYSKSPLFASDNSKTKNKINKRKMNRC